MLSLYSVIITISPYQPRTYLKAQKSLFNDKRPNIGIICRHGHSAEDSVSFAPCYYADIIAYILFQLCSATFDNRCTGCGCLFRSGLVPVPGSVRIRSEEYIVAVAAVNDVPADVHLKVGSRTGIFSSKLCRRGCDVFHVGPYAVHAAARYIFICPDLELADMVDCDRH